MHSGRRPRLSKSALLLCRTARLTPRFDHLAGSLPKTAVHALCCCGCLMEKENARKQTLEQLHERRKQVVRLHKKGIKIMQIVEMTCVIFRRRPHQTSEVDCTVPVKEKN